MLARFGINALKTTFSKRVLNVAQPARLISYSAISRGGHHHGHDPIIVGPGGKAGEVPTDLEQAAGHERLELLADLEGREFFDMTPPTMSHHGTKKNPVFVESTDAYRYVACTGFPVDSHEAIWLTLEAQHEHDRCPECGSVFKLKQTEYPDIPQGALLEHHEHTEPEKLS